MKLLAVVITALAAQAALPPAATTGPAEQVSTSTASVTGTVTPNGSATTAHFEYGTTTGYGLRTPDQDSGAGSAPVPVRAALDRLTPDTTYHYRVVAQSAAGVARGADRTLRTAAPPRVSTGGARAVGPTTATVAGSADPNRLATTVHFEVGTSTAYGRTTPEQAIGAGDASVAVDAPLDGLTPSTRYHYRLVATNAAGVVRGADRSFVTARGPTGVSISLSNARPVWGTGVTVSGAVSGRGAGGIPVGIERLDFPFTASWYQAAPNATASSRGAYTFAVPVLFSTTRLRVLTRSQVVVISPVATASVALKVGLRVARAPGSSVRLSGAVWPAVPNGRASLQRLTRSGRWIPVARTGLRALPLDRSRYAFTRRLARRTLNYRVVVIARDGGAHVPGTSRVRTLPARLR